MFRVLLVVGTRPNFMKAAPVYNALLKLLDPGIQINILHTGQHYDVNMSDVFLQQLGLTDCIKWLNVDLKGKSQNTQSALIMLALEEYVKEGGGFDLVVVFGDVTSTLAAALTANKMGIKLAHVESGNRSFDNSMPEEINRILVDHLSDVLFVSEPNGVSNLKMENITNSVFYVGNPMVDTVFNLKQEAAKLTTYQDMGLQAGQYILVTLHRPHNVDDPHNLQTIVDSLKMLAQQYTVLFPVHPRQRDKLELLLRGVSNIKLTEPQGYLQFLNLNMNCAVVVTDSGGVQEETTVLGIPCVTLRPNTERPITCTLGTNCLIKHLDKDVIFLKVSQLIKDRQSGVCGLTNKHLNIDMWDGKAGERIADILVQILK